MSNYPNMSYCQFENTMLAMEQVIGTLEAKGGGALRKMGRDEQRAMSRLYDLCQSYLCLANDAWDEARDEEWDGQPDEAQEWHDYDPDC